MAATDEVRRVVVALGGNAITTPGGSGSVEEDYRNLGISLEGIVTLVERGYRITLTHGNGPQVGNQMIRVERSLAEAPDLPLSVMVADVQGGLGYMMEQTLRNKFARRGIARDVCCLVTLVEVGRDDPAMSDPTKFVGPMMTEEQALERRDSEGWDVKPDRGRGWRRVVPSPEPISIVERDLIEILVRSGAVVIAAGGGGVPVVREADGELSAVGGVVDKDLASMVLALEIGATELYILTGVEKVAIHYGEPGERFLDQVPVSEARRYLAEGHFPAGSMGPKIEAACRFVEAGGFRSLITDIHTLVDAVDGKTGTWIVPG
ncbi:MAG: carbamate kinase [Acidobacteria bacterium]|nr:carbamate kinase [Acidobacteriota bacterium]